MKHLVIKLGIIALCMGMAVRLLGTEFFASPHGTPQGKGSRLQPWDFATALEDNTRTQSVNNVVKPGDTIWLRGGTYGVGSNVFSCKLRGTSNSSIVVRQYPGERAIIDGGINGDTGSWTTFWGFEITCSSARTNISANRPAGLVMNGVGHKAINLVIHDTGHPGIASYQSEGSGREIYGCIIWGVGIYYYDHVTYFPTNPWTRGAGVYLQNRDHAFFVSDNISSRNFTEGLKAYGQDGYVNGFVFDGNITFKNNVAGIMLECLGHSISNSTVINNLDYRSRGNQMGYFGDDVHARHYGLVYTNNYQATYPGYRQAVLWLKRWQSVNVVGNTIVTTSLTNEWVAATAVYGAGSGGCFVEIYPITNTMSYTINSNAYYGGVALLPPYKPFRYKVYEPEHTFVGWTNTYGFDRDSSYTTNLPAANVVVLRTNKYERGRAHIAVFNWQSNSTVSVDISNIGLSAGQRFEVRDAQDFLGTPVLTTNYNALQTTISLPLTMTNVTASTGGIENRSTDNPNIHTASLFNAFVVLPISAPLPTPPTGLGVMY